LLSDTLIEQEIGHGAALDFTAFYSCVKQYRHSLEVYWDSFYNSRGHRAV